MITRVISIAAFLVLTASVGHAEAQGSEAEGAKLFGFGAKAGVGITTLAEDTSLRVASRRGVVAGGFTNLKLFRPIDLQVEVLFARRDAIFEKVVTDELTYVELPVLARYTVRRRASWRVHVLGGATFGYVTEARESFQGGSSDDIKDKIEPYDLAAAVGADAEWKGRWVFDVRYLHGLTGIYVDVPDAFQAKHRVLQITAGYRFR